MGVDDDLDLLDAPSQQPSQDIGVEKREEFSSISNQLIMPKNRERFFILFFDDDEPRVGETRLPLLIILSHTHTCN